MFSGEFETVPFRFITRIIIHTCDNLYDVVAVAHAYVWVGSIKGMISF